MTTSPVKPVFRWAGSKRKLLPKLLLCVPQVVSRYVEPFAGSACLFFAAAPRRAVLGDFNPDLMATYRTLATRPEQVVSALLKFPVEPESYYELRSTDPSILTSITRAARFLYLNRFSFNGVYRTNRQGQFNVPRGTRTRPLPTITELLAAAKLLRRATLVAADFEESLGLVQPGDFVYLDPPYTVSDRRNRGEYGYGAFDEKDLDRLARSLVGLDKRGARFLLSYQYNNNARGLFVRWYQRRLRVKRHISGFIDRRCTVAELLVSNAPIPL